MAARCNLVLGVAPAIERRGASTPVEMGRGRFVTSSADTVVRRRGRRRGVVGARVGQVGGAAWAPGHTSRGVGTGQCRASQKTTPKTNTVWTCILLSTYNRPVAECAGVRSNLGAVESSIAEERVG